MRLGKVLRQWRTMEEKSIRVAAKEIGIGTASLVRIEHGKACGADTLANVLYWLIRDEVKKGGNAKAAKQRRS